MHAGYTGPRAAAWVSPPRSLRRGQAGEHRRRRRPAIIERAYSEQSGAFSAITTRTAPSSISSEQSFETTFVPAAPTHAPPHAHLLLSPFHPLTCPCLPSPPEELRRDHRTDASYYDYERWTHIQCAKYSGGPRWSDATSAAHTACGASADELRSDAIVALNVTWMNLRGVGFRAEQLCGRE